MVARAASVVKTDHHGFLNSLGTPKSGFVACAPASIVCQDTLDHRTRAGLFVLYLGLAGTFAGNM